MIVEEILSNNMVRHYSSDGKYIKQVGADNLYQSAIDVYPCPYVYEEYDGELPADDDPTDKAEAYDILTGVIQ